MPPKRYITRRLADHPAPTPLSTPCRLWQGITAYGYGIRPSRERQHRWVLRTVGEDQHGTPWNPDLEVMHLCDNRACYRFDHLRLGTRTDNARDASVKGRARNRNSGRTHCKRGHEFTPENTYWFGNGKRACRTCRADWDRERRRRP